MVYGMVMNTIVNIEFMKEIRFPIGIWDILHIVNNQSLSEDNKFNGYIWYVSEYTETILL